MTNTIQESNLQGVLKTLLTKHQLSGMKLAKAIALPPQTVNRLVSGQVTDPKSSTLLAIAHYFGLSIDQLLGNSALPTEDFMQPASLERKSQAIPLFNLSTHAKHHGQPSPDWFYWPVPFAKISDYAAICVDNDKYSVKFPLNTTLIVNQHLSPQDGDMVLIHTREHTSIKRYVIDGDEHYLYPLQEGHKITSVHESDIRVAGIIIEAIIHIKPVQN